MTERPAHRPRRPVRARPAATTPEDLETRDPMGRMALFSETQAQPATALGWFVECSSCLEETPVSALGLVKLTLPLSIHLPLVRRYGSFMRCPACGRRTWLRVGLRV